MAPKFNILERKTSTFFFSRVVVKKNNVEWSDDNKNIHYSVERLFTRDGEFDETLLNQEGAFVDILRVVNFLIIYFYSFKN